MPDRLMEAVRAGESHALLGCGESGDGKTRRCAGTPARGDFDFMLADAVESATFMRYEALQYN